MTIATILETLMLVGFGAAWPASIYKSWKSRTAKGKSIAFLVIIFCSYLVGIAKVIITDGPTGFLMIPYMIDILMVFCDMMFYFRNRRIDKALAQVYEVETENEYEQAMSDIVANGK